MSNYTEWSDRELREEINDRDILTGDINEYDTEELIEILQEDDAVNEASEEE